MNPMQIWHPYTHPVLDPAPLMVDRADGCYLYTPEGRRVLDAISSWWVTVHGHANPRIAAAIAEQASKLEQVIFAGFSHPAAEELGERLGEILPGNLEVLFFSDDGSTAVEVALKMAVQFWQNAGMPKKQRFVALERAYHGDTVGAMSVSADSDFNVAFQGLLFPVERAHTAYCLRCPAGRERSTCSIECSQSLERILDASAEEIAAVIVEPMIQGAGGMIIQPPEFLRRVRDLTSRYGVLLIADEVFTGFGRCGKMFACEIAGVDPDIMCLSKGLTGGFLPLGATVCTRRIFDAFRTPQRSQTFFHGHSYTANPISCAAALANLEIFRTEPVFGRIDEIARIHRQETGRLRDHPAVAEVRSIGTVAAIELKTDDAGYHSRLRPPLYNFFLERDVLLRPLGNVVYIVPPYAITPGELRHVYGVIAEALDVVR